MNWVPVVLTNGENALLTVFVGAAAYPRRAQARTVQNFVSFMACTCGQSGGAERLPEAYSSFLSIKMIIFPKSRLSMKKLCLKL